MKWVWVLMFVFGCAICGMAGLTAGINLNPASTVRFVPAWGSLGDWVSGIGALSAVIVTLWLADKQRREDAELLKVASNGSVPVGTGFVGDPFISLELTSQGKRPVTVTGLAVTSKHSTMRLALTGFANHSPTKVFPVRLEYGQRASVHLISGADTEITKFVEEYCGGRSDGLHFVAITTTGYWEGKCDQSLLQFRSRIIEMKSRI